MAILKESGAEHLARLAKEKAERESGKVIDVPVLGEGTVVLTPAQKAAKTKAANKAKKEAEEAEQDEGK